MNARSLLLAIASLMGIAASAAAQTGTVRLEWDANSEASLAGYIVYVGNASGSYQEQYDAGLQTSFVYAAAVPGRLYFFSVAAYALGPQVGPRSDEVLFLTGVETILSPSAVGLEGNVEAPHSVSAAAARSSTPGTLCLGDGCYRVDLIADVAGQARALARSADGRLFFIENEKFVRVIQDGSLVSGAALSANPAATLSGLVLDPEFTRTGYVYVGVVEPGPEGGRELSVIRYRAVANVLGEGAMVVAGLPFAVGRDASLAVDADRRLYVALPATAVGDPRADRYAGMVLRFEGDGTAVRADGAAAPVFSPGYSDPTSLVWSGEGNRLWLAGRGAAWAGTLASLSLDAATSRSAVPERIALAAPVLVDEAGGVVRVEATPGGIVTTPWIAPNELGDRVVGAAGGARDSDLFLLLIGQGDPATLSSRIVRLRRLPAQPFVCPSAVFHRSHPSFDCER